MFGRMGCRILRHLLVFHWVAGDSGKRQWLRILASLVLDPGISNLVWEPALACHKEWGWNTGDWKKEGRMEGVLSHCNWPRSDHVNFFFLIPGPHLAHQPHHCYRTQKDSLSRLQTQRAGFLYSSLTSSYVLITTVIIISSPLRWGQGWVYSSTLISHLDSSLRVQVRWWKHCPSIATAGSLVSVPIIMPISTLYIKPFQQP